MVAMATKKLSYGDVLTDPGCSTAGSRYQPDKPFAENHNPLDCHLPGEWHHLPCEPECRNVFVHKYNGFIV